MIIRREIRGRSEEKYFLSRGGVLVIHIVEQYAQHETLLVSSPPWTNFIISIGRNHVSCSVCVSITNARRRVHSVINRTIFTSPSAAYRTDLTTRVHYGWLLLLITLLCNVFIFRVRCFYVRSFLFTRVIRPVRIGGDRVTVVFV